MSDLWPEMEVGEPMDFGPHWVVNIGGDPVDDGLVAEIWGSTPAQALSRARAVAAIGAYEALAEAVREEIHPEDGGWLAAGPSARLVTAHAALLARLEADDGA